MRSLREIKTSISHAKVGAKPEADRTVLRHLLAEFESAPGAASASTGRREWRTVTKSRSLKAVAAAALVALALIVARRPQGSCPPPTC